MMLHIRNRAPNQPLNEQIASSSFTSLFKLYLVFASLVACFSIACDDETTFNGGGSPEINVRPNPITLTAVPVGEITSTYVSDVDLAKYDVGGVGLKFTKVFLTFVSTSKSKTVNSCY